MIGELLLPLAILLLLLAETSGIVGLTVAVLIVGATTAVDIAGRTDAEDTTVLTAEGTALESVTFNFSFKAKFTLALLLSVMPATVEGTVVEVVTGVKLLLVEMEDDDTIAGIVTSGLSESIYEQEIELISI